MSVCVRAYVLIHYMHPDKSNSKAIHIFPPENAVALH